VFTIECGAESAVYHDPGMGDVYHAYTLVSAPSRAIKEDLGRGLEANFGLKASASTPFIASHSAEAKVYA